MKKNVIINNYIVGILSIPDNFSGKIPFVLFLHGFGSDKNEVGDIFITVANKLIDRNIGSLRIDFSGFGESTAITSEITIEQLLSDASISIDYILKQDFVDFDRIGLCGFSLGAGISVLLMQDYGSDIKSMALLSPAGNLPEDFSTYLGLENFNRLEKSEDEVELDLGWRKINLKNKFVHSLRRHYLMDSITKYKGAFFVVAGTNDFSYKHANQYISSVASENKKILVIDRGDHIFNAFDKEKSTLNQVTNEVVGWFKKTL